MPRRERNWKPDIYDMTRDRPAAEPDLDVQDMAEEDTAEPQLDVRDMAEEDVVAPLAASAERAVVGNEQVVVAEMPSRPSMRVVRLVPPPPPRENDTLVGLVAGAVVGAALTLLLTPSSGNDLRARLQARLRGLSGSAPNRAETLAQKLPNNTASGSDPTAGEQNR